MHGIISSGVHVIDAVENCTLMDVGDTTVWQVNMDMNDRYVLYMEDTWPLVMAKVKEVAEQH